MMRKLQNSGATLGHGVDRRLGDLLGVGLARIGDVALEQQRIAEIGAMQRRDRVRAAASSRFGLQPLQRVVGQRCRCGCAPARALDQFVDARHRLVERAGGDQAQHPGNLDLACGCRARP